MKIFLVQYDPIWENKELNKKKIQSLISKVKIDDVSLIILPEMTLTGFSMEAVKLAEEIPGESFNFFSSIAKEKSAHIFFGLIEYSEDKFFNTLIHIDSNGLLLNKYRKIHPFSCSGEDRHYTKGNETVVTKVNEIGIGLSICYDLRFPELYRLYGKARAELVIDIANWPVQRIEHWRTLLKARAIENQCFIVGVNRVGKDPFHEYNGYSSIFTPMGEEIISVPDAETIITAEIDLDEVKAVRKKLPFLNDIRLI